MSQQDSTQVESARMYQLWVRSKASLPELLAEVEALCLGLSKVADTSLSTIDLLQELVVSLQEQV